MLSLDRLILLLFLCSQGVASWAGDARLVFDFSSGKPEGSIRDVEGKVVLKPRGKGAVQWADDGVQLGSGAFLAVEPSDPGVRSFIDAVKENGQLSIAISFTTLDQNQKGPARLVSLSSNSSTRNFTLGQDGEHLDFRLRTTRTSRNGLPSTPGDSVYLKKGKRCEVVVTHQADGEISIRIDGQVAGSRKVGGDFSNWDRSLALVIGDEFTGNRPWSGVIHRLELGTGYDGSIEAVSDKPIRSRSAGRFESEVAGILATHCLECHEPGNAKGKLDLSRKDRAFRTGRGEVVIHPGSAGDSLLWQVVHDDEMPENRPPLSAAEKDILKQWIDSGAEWPLDRIDPAIYAGGKGAGGHWARRLTIAEYVSSIETLFGIDVSKEAGELLPTDTRADGFRNTAYNLKVDLSHIEAYGALARSIVDRIDPAQFARQFSSSRSIEDKALRKIIEPMGRLILRGDLTREEINDFRGIVSSVAAAGGDFEEGIALMIEGMLQSPRFLYRVETAPPPGRVSRVTDDELASRLSFMICGTAPDAELLSLAQSGVLRDSLEETIEKLIGREEARTQSVQFIRDWLHLERLESLSPDPERFPGWSDSLARSAASETEQFFVELIWERERPLVELLNADFSYLSAELARHYGIEPDGDEPRIYDLGDRPERGGILTQVSVLTVGGDEASMVSRGLFVLHELLRGVVKDPPPCVDTNPVPSKPGLSQRDVATDRIRNRNCGGCHSKFEPLAFGLEKYDGIGAYHEEDEYGNQLRDDGEMKVPGEDDELTYRTSAELMDLLAGSERVSESMVWKLTQFFLGRPLGWEDAGTMEEVVKAAEAGGGTYQATVKAIATSDLILFKKGSQNEGGSK